MTNREKFEARWPVPDGIVFKDGEYRTTVRFFTAHRDKKVEELNCLYLSYTARYEAWCSREPDVWEFAKPLMAGNMARIECFGGHLFIVNSAGKVLYEGWNGDNSRNGETKTWNVKRREWE